VSRFRQKATDIRRKPKRKLSFASLRDLLDLQVQSAALKGRFPAR
jgi:hypothetical protein